MLQNLCGERLPGCQSSGHTDGRWISPTALGRGPGRYDFDVRARAQFWSLGLQPDGLGRLLF